MPVSDVNNIYVNGVNHGLLDPYVFLDQVDMKRVNYIHIAGHDEEHSAAQVVEDLEGECAEIGRASCRERV